MQLNGVTTKKYSQKKLVADFRNRVDYVCHIENLKFYLEKRMKLLKVHEIMSFDQVIEIVMFEIFGFDITRYISTF